MSCIGKETKYMSASLGLDSGGGRGSGSGVTVEYKGFFRVIKCYSTTTTI